MGRSVITGTGSYIPEVVKKNSDFAGQIFYTHDRTAIEMEPHIIIDKFKKITGIAERRYVSDTLTTSDISALAGKIAIEHSNVDAETLDLIIVAHNFGDVGKQSIQTDTVPSIANRVKHILRINNPNCIAFDVLFGCPGWILGVTQADAFFKAGMAKKALIIGAETLSRVIDVYDRDSMIFSDGAGAIVLEYQDTATKGILSSSALTHSIDEAFYINMDQSYQPDKDSQVKYLKMKGRKVYEYALKFVPQAMKDCLDKAMVRIDDLKKIFIHQANEKMDEAIVHSLYKLYGIQEMPKDIMPMCIQYLGNSSVATIPTLYDLILKGQDVKHDLKEGDVVLFASVGAGMNINAMCYRL